MPATTDKQTSARLLKTYGIDLDEYNQLLKDQKGTCAICHNPPATRRLHVDHDHSHRYVKVVSTKLMGGYWRAAGVYKGLENTFLGFSKSEAVQAFRRWAKKESVRGLLCPKCNRGLEFFRDKPELFDKAAKYLRKFLNE